MSKTWANLSDKQIAFQFFKRAELLFFPETDGSDRLCIPRTMTQDIFYEAHDAQAHHLGKE